LPYRVFAEAAAPEAAVTVELTELLAVAELLAASRSGVQSAEQDIGPYQKKTWMR
jgi:hypothetical protein